MKVCLQIAQIMLMAFAFAESCEWAREAAFRLAALSLTAFLYNMFLRYIIPVSISLIPASHSSRFSDSAEIFFVCIIRYMLSHPHYNLNDISMHCAIRHLMSDFVAQEKSRAFAVVGLKKSSEMSTTSMSTVSTPNLVEEDDLRRIDEGKETRTTLMIKKVPRKYTLEILRREVDEVLACTNTYDLLYLPVDSAKMTNRGYAFINFASAKSLAVFVRAFRSREWSELNRRSKVAVIQWAYVQGRDATLAHINTEVNV